MVRDDPRLGRTAALLLGTAGLVLCGASVAVTLTGSAPGGAGLAVRQALIVGVPIAVGLYAARQGPYARFGKQLVALGLLAFLATLSAASSSVPYSVGRVAGWIIEAGLIYLILAFPSGRLEARVDRLLFRAAVALIVLLYLPSALIVHAYPLPTWWTDCRGACPANALSVVSVEPGWADDVLSPVREGLTILLFLGVTLRLAYRIRAATRLMRRTLLPVLAFAMLHIAGVGAALAVRRAGAASGAIDLMLWVVAMGIPAMALGFLVGILSWRLFAATALQRLAADVGRHPAPGELRALVARWLDDPSVEIVYWAQTNGGGWIDAEGTPVPPPDPDSNRCVTEIRDGDRAVAAIVHDAGLRDEREFVEAVGALMLMALENHRLTARVQASLREVRESRARIQMAADDERRRIERDLHDGAQQRLVALRIRLELIEELTTRDPDRSRSLVHGLGPEVTAALEEVKTLAAGVYPALLEDLGLVDALRSAAMRSPIPTSLDVNGGGRYPRDVEAAVYFCCLEALQNAAKHAGGATRVTVSLTSDDQLHFEVRDNGSGFARGDLNGGVGLTNMRDRVASVGGRVDIRSTPGVGTTVAGAVPLA